MKFKVGDVVWFRGNTCKAEIKEIAEEGHVFKIAYVGTGRRVREKYVGSDDLLHLLVNCPACGKNLRVINGKTPLHMSASNYCWGSFLPQR